MKKELKIPKHIAFIMDGNGRWAKKRGLERHFGHKKGAEAMREVVKRCFELGIYAVSFYAFSTENFKRPKQEVDKIFEYTNEFLLKFEQEFKDMDIKLHIMGEPDMLPDPVKSNLLRVVEETKNCKKGVINLGIAYGGRMEIAKACAKLAKGGKTEITEEDISREIYTSNLPDPDLIVRASGEQRLSNFMLWQCAYSEFYFPKTFWPDFNAKMVDKCIKEFNKRQRRFGNV